MHSAVLTHKSQSLSLPQQEGEFQFQLSSKTKNLGTTNSNFLRLPQLISHFFRTQETKITPLIIVS